MISKLTSHHCLFLHQIVIRVYTTCFPRKLEACHSSIQHSVIIVASLLDNHHDRFSRAESHDHFFFLLKLAFFTRCLFSPFSCLLVFRMLVNSARRFGEILDQGFDSGHPDSFLRYPSCISSRSSPYIWTTEPFIFAWSFCCFLLIARHYSTSARKSFQSFRFLFLLHAL